LAGNSVKRRILAPGGALGQKGENMARKPNKREENIFFCP
jgi:hypothetical protein